MGLLMNIAAAVGDSVAIGNAVIVAGFVDVAAKAALILLGALAATRMLRHGAASTRHQVWTVALTCVLALPLLSAALPTWRVPLLPGDSAVGIIEGDAVRLNRGPEASSATLVPQRSQTLPSYGAESGAPPIASPSAIASPSVLASPRLAVVLLLSWMAGSALLLARVAVSSLAAWRVVRRADPLGAGALREQASSVQRSLGIRAAVRLVRSREITVPMAWGVVRPTVLLPAECDDWTADRGRVVLLHEMAHLKRRDCQTLLLARIVTALHWFNPLAWVATRSLQAERERACDDLVLTAGTRAPDYAQHLLEIARRVRTRAFAPGAAVAMARPNELEGRLLAILDPDRNRRGITRPAALAGVLVILLLVLPLAALQPRAQATEGLQEPEDSLEAAVEEPVSGLAGVAEAEQGIDPRVIEAFLNALRDEDAEIREQAPHSLGSIESPQAVVPLGEVLQSDDRAQVREQAAWALGMIEDEAAVPALSAALTDADADVREQAAWALGMIESSAAVEALSVVLRSDESADVREQAAWALGMIEDDAALDALLDALTDENARVRRQVLWAVGHIAG